MRLVAGFIVELALQLEPTPGVLGPQTEIEVNPTRFEASRIEILSSAVDRVFEFGGPGGQVNEYRSLRLLGWALASSLSCKRTPTRAKGKSSEAFSLRQGSWAASASLKAKARPAVRDPAPLV
jgi:hypothetical protein